MEPNNYNLNNGNNNGQPSPYGPRPAQPPYGQYPQQPYPPASPTGYQPLQPLQPNPYSGYNPNAYPGEVDSPRAKGGKAPNKLIFGVIAGIVVLAVLAAVAIALTGNKNSGTSTTTTPSTNSNAGDDIVPRSDGQLDLSAKVDTTTSIKEQTVKAKTKEQLNLSSGFSFMATKIETFTPSDPNVKPAAGKQFVAVSLAAGNRAQSNTLSVSYLDFKLRDNDNNLLAGHPSTQAILGNALANPTSLKPGEQVTGKIVFEVDATDTDWVLVHKESYQKTTDNTTFNVEGDAVVSLKSTTTTSPATSPATTPPATTP